LEAFDDYVRAVDNAKELVSQHSAELGGIYSEKGFVRHLQAGRDDPEVEAKEDRPDAILTAIQEQQSRSSSCPGLQDPHARASDMDAEGIAADVIFNGGQNGEGMPFMDMGFNRQEASLLEQIEAMSRWQRNFVNEPSASPLSAVGVRIYNRWLADFVSADPDRHVGLAHLPIWDVEGAVEELRWCREHGLRGVNSPAPRQTLTPTMTRATRPCGMSPKS
jgi:predicted TIM-barrel fold metal-dependent hydrolase